MNTLSNDGTSAITGPHRARRYVREDQTVPEDATTIDAVMEWVGDDRTRAETALRTEKDGEGRVTLIKRLDEMLAEPVEPVTIDSSEDADADDEDEPDKG